MSAWATTVVTTVVRGKGGGKHLGPCNVFQDCVPYVRVLFNLAGEVCIGCETHAILGHHPVIAGNRVPLTDAVDALIGLITAHHFGLHIPGVRVVLANDGLS